MGALVLLCFTLIVVLHEERINNGKERETLLNRIADPQSVAWQSMTMENPDENTQSTSVDLVQTASGAEDGELYLVGKVLGGENKENDDK